VLTSPKLDTLLSHAGLLGAASLSKRDDLQNRDLAGETVNEMRKLLFIAFNNILLI
jgi:hypothetical protein